MTEKNKMFFGDEINEDEENEELNSTIGKIIRRSSLKEVSVVQDFLSKLNEKKSTEAQ